MDIDKWIKMVRLTWNSIIKKDDRHNNYENKKEDSY